MHTDRREKGMASNTSNRGKNNRSVHSAKTVKNGKRIPSKKRKARQQRRIILFAVELIALVVLVGAIVAVSTIGKMERVHINEENIVFNESVEENQEMKGYRNIALFAVDSRKGKLGKGQRTDTIMIASINQDTGDVKLCSVYRDTYLNLGNDKYNKANAAYAQGGPEQALNMLNWNFDMNITEYITVGFDALIEVIDALGGVQIDVAENEINDLNNYQRSMFVEDENDPLNENIVKVTEPGLQTLNGLQATAYCRIRYVGDDYGRTERQRKVLMACMDKAKQASPTTLVEILNSAIDDVSTNLDLGEMASILQDVNSYQIVAQDGVPFESNRSTGNIGSKGDCVVPLDLTDNVTMLHEFLFGVENYAPSEQVQEYSEKIKSDTAAYVR
ncbi:MAG: transcriptional regulator [Clostridiales bacterium]|nr:MAG: transcriptional regulator [Clostridiales bacterium]